MIDRAYSAYLYDCCTIRCAPVTQTTFRKFYGTADTKPRAMDPSPVSFEYAEYLASMRGVNGPHICGRNIDRLKIGGEDFGCFDGVCSCEEYYFYSQCDHRDEWRLPRSPIGEDFFGEFLKN